MRFVTFHNGAAPVPGVIVEDEVVDLRAAAHMLAGPDGSVEGLPPGAFASLLDLIEAGPAALDVARKIAATADRFADARHPLAAVRLMAPIPRTRKNVFCVGRNYAEHAIEGYKARNLEVKIPEYPQFFTKPWTTIIGPCDEVPFDSSLTDKLDYEVELALILGKGGRDIREEDALDHVFGYTVLNDITGRDLQRRHEQWFKGKSIDGSCPMGPWIVLKEDIADPQALDISLTVNGEVRQNGSTAQMIFPIRRIIHDLSRGLTLEAGDVIATGTPSGVGYAMEPPCFLKPGDVVECRVKGIGALVNTIAADAARATA